MMYTNTPINIFAPTLKRTQILNLAQELDFTNTRPITIAIHRNHAFEPIQSVITPFLHTSNLKPTFIYSDYDDSLNFGTLTSDIQASKKTDIEIVFLDLHRYKIQGEELDYFIHTRLQALRHLTQAPILVLLLQRESTPLNPQFKALEKAHIFTLSLNELYETYRNLAHTSKPLLDPVKESITGTKLSNTATLALAQILGLKYIPSLILPNLKAIVLDLDNTLYHGVLGEDTSSNLTLTPAHKALQELVLQLKKQGYLLAIASKNELQDAEAMFASRSDFPLQWKDFDAIKVNWNSKAENLKEIAQYFNIGLDSMLFIDDNLAEIESTKFLNIKQIHATTPQDTLLTLHLYPQVYKFNTSKEDVLRGLDITANATRENLKLLSDEEYFQNLAIELEFRINLKADGQRIYELMNKTNQFIANYTRPSLAQVQEWLEDDKHCIVSIAMRDRLSDSGIVGIVVGKIITNQDIKLHIQDIAISCRALGRRLESTILTYAFCLIKERLSCMQNQVFIHFQKGERNTPFLNTLQTLLSTQSPTLTLPQPYLMPAGLSISITKEEL